MLCKWFINRLDNMFSKICKFSYNHHNNCNILLSSQEKKWWMESLNYYYWHQVALGFLIKMKLPHSFSFNVFLLNILVLCCYRIVTIMFLVSNNTETEQNSCEIFKIAHHRKRLKRVWWTTTLILLHISRNVYCTSLSIKSWRRVSIYYKITK